MANKALQKGDLVLITGATGWIGSHVVDKALSLGLKTRLAVRSESKAKGLIDSLKQKYGKDAYIETTIVKDFDHENAYDEAIKGVQGVIHTASTVTFSDKWDDVIPPTINGYSALLKAAHAQGEAIKRVVLTSSVVAVSDLDDTPGKPISHIDSKSWNEVAVKEAKTNPNPRNVYAASKVLSEQFAWDFVKENKSKFILNTVHPGFTTGGKLEGQDFMSTAVWLRGFAFEAKPLMFGATYQIDVDDAALLHVLAVTQDDIVDERILGHASQVNWKQINEIVHKYRPDKANTPPNSETKDNKVNTVVDISRTLEILKPYGGFKSLEESLRLNFLD